MTLRGRLALVNVSILLIALLLLAAIVFNQLSRDLYEQLDQELALLSANELSRVEIVSNTPLFTANAPATQQLKPEGFARLLDTRGRVTDGAGHFRTIPVLPQSLQTPPQGLITNQTSPNGLPLRVYTRPILAGNRVVGYLQVAVAREEIQETLDTIRRGLLIGVPLTLLITGAISLLAARQALQPLTQMTHSAAAITADDLSERLPVPKAKDEVQELALAFNATLDRLAAAFLRQRRFTADASHELRTPVTAILGQAEYALNRARSPEAYQSILSRIQHEAERMQRLIGRMLALARVETGRHPLSIAPTDIGDLIRTLVNPLQPQAAAKGLALNVDAPTGLVIATDADSLTQILLNLLENAIHYTEQGHVTITAAESAGQLCLTVSDTGPGIPAEHLPDLFQPFYRVDPSRSHSHGHVGLGLALTHELVQLLGGQISVTSQPQQGATFSVTLPAKRPQ
ncbi:MAG: Adaptive-response sensory-kinase SasA [Anaerolineae bacterium]|nr:Adaptive-response sensory-kinase SasA [Anaerolineae bacterium]